MAQTAVHPAFCPTSGREITDLDADPVREVVAALWTAIIVLTPTGDEVERWQIGDPIFSNCDLLWPAESRGLVEAS